MSTVAKLVNAPPAERLEHNATMARDAALTIAELLDQRPLEERDLEWIRARYANLTDSLREVSQALDALKAAPSAQLRAELKMRLADDPEDA